MGKRFAAVVLGTLLVASAHAATMEDEVRAVFDKYIAAQNAHDLKTVRTLLLESPDLLWISQGRPLWGRDAALKGLEDRYRGTWHIDVDRKEFRVVSVSRRVAQVYAQTQLTMGDPGVEPARNRVYINLVMVKKPEGWRIASILPILVPPQ
ncbi:MAG TPA: SgcJ/EcaC family oxidoreductase [Burkholderiales bacterium]|jgi:uncharacterized protein (TIGR02246 family)